MWGTGSGRLGFSSSSSQAQQLRLMDPGIRGLRTCGSRAQRLRLMALECGAQQLWCVSVGAPRHVKSSWIRDRTRVHCTGSWILIHCATRAVPGEPCSQLGLLHLFQEDSAGEKDRAGEEPPPQGASSRIAQGGPEGWGRPSSPPQAGRPRPSNSECLSGERLWPRLGRALPPEGLHAREAAPPVPCRRPSSAS